MIYPLVDLKIMKSIILDTYLNNSHPTATPQSMSIAIIEHNGFLVEDATFAVVSAPGSLVLFLEVADVIA